MLLDRLGHDLKQLSFVLIPVPTWNITAILPINRRDQIDHGLYRNTWEWISFGMEAPERKVHQVIIIYLSVTYIHILTITKKTNRTFLRQIRSRLL